MITTTEEFKVCSREAFRFLLQDHGFRELSDLRPNHSNPFQARFTNESLEILVLGEGYGSVTSVLYVTEDGTEVPTQVLEPDWKPFNKRNRRNSEASQQEQIIAAAEQIKAKDCDILSGNLGRLTTASLRWRAIIDTKNWESNRSTS